MESTYQAHFYRNMLAIAIPVALQNLITSCLNMLDTVMISSLGSEAIAGVGLANQVFFFYILICFGINTGSSVIISQYWGRNDRRNVQRVNGLASSLSLILGIVFTFFAFFFPNFVMSLLTGDTLVIESGSSYLKVVSISYILTAVSTAYGTSLRSTGEPNPPLFASIAGFFTNAFFNYVLIFGALFFPTMGIVGAAWGTVIARFVEFVIIMVFTYNYAGPINTSLKAMLDFDQPFLATYFKIVSPVIINETFWSLGQVLYNIAYAMTGTESTAAVQVAAAIQNILFVLIRGLSSSGTIMIGSTIGRGEKEKAYALAIKFIKIILAMGIFMGAVIILTRNEMILLFGNLSPEVSKLASDILIVSGIFYVVKAFNAFMVVGVLRGGGDTKFSMVMETATVWLVGVPLAFLGALVFHFPVYLVMILVLMDEVVKSFIAVWRLRSKKWIHII